MVQEKEKEKKPTTELEKKSTMSFEDLFANVYPATNGELSKFHGPYSLGNH